jgi:hypothetical protein
MNGNTALVDLLKQYKPDTTVVDIAGFTAIEYALNCTDDERKIQMVKSIVVDCGANLENKCSLTNNTALREAVIARDLNTTTLLLKLGADPQSLDHLGNPLIDVLVIGEYPVEWFQLFISFGALIGSHIDFQGKTSEQIEELTKGQAAWAATAGENNEAISTTPGFTNALTNLDTLKKFLYNDAGSLNPINSLINHDALIRATKKCADFANRTELKDIVILLEKAKLRIENNLKHLATLSIFKNPLLLSKLPPELQEYAAHVAAYEEALKLSHLNIPKKG